MKNKKILMNQKIIFLDGRSIVIMMTLKEGLEESMRKSEFILGKVDLLKYKFNEISLRRGRSSIDSTKWLKNKK